MIHIIGNSGKGKTIEAVKWSVVVGGLGNRKRVD